MWDKEIYYISEYYCVKAPMTECLFKLTAINTQI